MRGSSVHFKRISSALHAVSHASREVPPEYLLPADVSMGTHVVIDDHGQVQKALDHKMHLASRQAKATKDYSPLWEGVINLPEPSPDVTPAHQIQIVRQWCKDYEAMTGHKVLRADVHLDEGYIDADGKPHFNAHAHVMCDRTDEKGRVKKLTSTVLREVQNMTAEVTTLQRGIDSRKTGRKHIGHQHFRFDAEKNRLDVEKPKADLARLQKKSKEWSDADLSKINQLQAKLDGEPARQAAALAAQKLQLDEQYRKDREALKASGEAKQADYQALKKAHEKALADLATAQAEAAKVPGLVAQVGAIEAQATTARQGRDEAQQQAAQQAQELAQLKAEYAAERAQLKASGEATQRDYQALKKAHEAALAKLKNQDLMIGNLLKNEAVLREQVPGLVAQVKALKPEADKVPGLVADLAKAQQEAQQVPNLVEQVNTAQERYTTLRTKALAIQSQRDDLAKKVETMTAENQALTEANAKLEADKARFAAMAQAYQAEKAAGVPAHMIEPSSAPSKQNQPQAVRRPVEAQNRPVEAPKPSKAPSPSPIQEKTLVERLAASLAAMLEWLKAIGGVQEPVQAQGIYIGPVKHIDELHCIQKTGRRYAVHQLANLDAVPALDDPKMEIQYRDGKGQVSGKTIPGLQR